MGNILPLFWLYLRGFFSCSDRSGALHMTRVQKKVQSFFQKTFYILPLSCPIGEGLFKKHGKTPEKISLPWPAYGGFCKRHYETPDKNVRLVAYR